MKQQRIDGSWTDQAIIVSYFATCRQGLDAVKEAEVLLGKVKEELAKQGMRDYLDVAAVTLLVLAILSQKLKARHAEWSLLERKARRYLSDTAKVQRIEALINLPAL